MESTNKQLRSLIGRYKVDPNLNINPLSMKLGGIIDAAVMGGVSNFEKVSCKIRLKPWFTLALKVLENPSYPWTRLSLLFKVLEIVPD